MEPRTLLAVPLVWAVLFMVPIFVYGALSAATGLQPPGGNPALFLTGTAISKLGTAIAFVAVFHLGRDMIGSQWLLYVGIWWLMFALGELGQAITLDYSWQEAAAGLISETIYFPVAGLILVWLVRS